ncbi:MAG: NAD(P)H-dependent oxidoreductase [Candidatus Omnitrophica bacterium]|nr:NAD(P)H-dependent oxidoreductase [Candidatus Omnitrophota bacterium]
MAKILIIYYSRSGNTKKMASFIKSGVKMEENVEVSLKDVAQTQVKELLDYDGIIIGSPTYYGSMAAQIKRLLDESVCFHGRLEGKVGAAFSSAANIGGGNETTITDILKAMLIHGMIIRGNSQGDHYGPVSIGSPNQRVEKQCKTLGQRMAKLVKLVKAVK